MINKTNSVGFNPTNGVNKSNNIKEANSSKIAFGCMEYITWSSGLADYSKKIYALRKNMTFYKIFPFLNPKPKTTTYNHGTELIGENLIGHRDKMERIGELKKVYEKLVKKNKA